MAQTKMGHRSDEITSYLSDALEPEQRASVEAHLETCEECQTQLGAQRALFDQVNQALAFKPKRTIDEQVARFEREVAAERGSGRARPPARRKQLVWGLPLALGIAASAAAVVLLVHQPESDKGPNTMATHQPAADAGAEKLGYVAAPRPPKVPLDGRADAGAEDVEEAE